MTTRSEVVAAARGWIDTPFLHQGRARGAGVDCVGLLIGVGRELGIVAPQFDITGYSRVPDGRSFLDIAGMHMSPITQKAMQAGDAVVVRFDHDPQHVGILGDYRHGGLSIIHALGVTAGRVVETRLLFHGGMRFVAAYRLPGVT